MTETPTNHSDTPTPASEASARTPGEHDGWRRLPRTELGRFVSRRAAELQRAYLDGSPAAKGALARLRRTVGRPSGADPAAWEVVYVDFPEDLVGHGDAPSREEVAAHEALGLLAVHLQSAGQPVHVPGVGLGQAVRRLASPSDGASREKPVMRRFQALGTAEVLDEALHHARGLVQQFRHPPGSTVPIGLDYGLLAEDLVDLQQPRRRDAVRLRWARDLYAGASTTSTTETDSEE